MPGLRRDADLPVGVLLCDLPVAECPQITAADLDPLTFSRRSAQRPFRRAAIASGEMVVIGVAEVRDATEAGGEGRADRTRTDEPLSPGVRPARTIEDGVIGEVLHDPIEVVRVEPLG